LKACIKPLATLMPIGVTPIETRVAALTVREAEPDMPFIVAVMLVVPGCNSVASPAEAAAMLIVATAEFDELQVTRVERSCFEPSE
jgi:hypothetical protein